MTCAFLLRYENGEGSQTQGVCEWKMKDMLWCVELVGRCKAMQDPRVCVCVCVNVCVCGKGSLLTWNALLGVCVCEGVCV